MGFDATLRRSFPLLIGFALGTAAYLQAWGLSRLVASSLGQPARAAASRAASLAESPHVPEHETSASPILGRNPFDSVTGPLDRILDHPLFQGRDGEEDPRCDGARVVLIAAARGTERWSFAFIIGPDGVPRMRREGDEVGGRTVIGIGWDRVWLARDGARCQLELGRPGTEVAAGRAIEPGTAPPRRTLEADIAARIRKAGERELEIDRSAVDDILAHYPELFGRLRIAPEKEGVRIFGIRPGSVASALGLTNGDRIENINGFDVRDPRQVMEAYARLQNSDHLAVALTRAGKKQTVELKIR